MEACDQRVAESEQLDWKRDLPLPSAGSSGDFEVRARALELAKDLAAMANGRGGMVVYGVQETGGLASGIASVGDLADGEQVRRVRQVAYNLIYPPVRVDCIHLTDGTSHVLAVAIPESDDAPHLVQPKRDGGNDGWLIAPYRSGPDTLNMVEKQIEAAYRQRIEGRRRRVSDLADLHRETDQRHVTEDDHDSGSVVVAVLPVRPRRGVLPGSHPSHTATAWVQAAVALSTQLSIELLGGCGLPINLLGEAVIPRRALRRHVFSATRQLRGADREPIGQPAEVVVELHDDGAFGLVWRRGGVYSFGRTAGSPPPTPSIASSDVQALELLILALVVTADEQLGLACDCEAQIGVWPPRPLYVIPDAGWADDEYSTVPSPPDLWADIALSGPPDDRASDMLMFAGDFNDNFERSGCALDRFWELPIGTWTGHPRLELARRLFGGEPDHPTSGRSMT
ncbi:AlbA family DNA-binding domain-containing protein [Nocardioides immobilis]|uniref:AlbA family DNA-binding domain-containing protein n=1 Tax=Nocardioides immobilis TaxID=2049295 RepID=UPI0015FC17D7|nr:ATP-binding protein [Nocardioides immobilis]